MDAKNTFSSTIFSSSAVLFKEWMTQTHISQTNLNPNFRLLCIIRQSPFCNRSYWGPSLADLIFVIFYTDTIFTSKSYDLVTQNLSPNPSFVTYQKASCEYDTVWQARSQPNKTNAEIKSTLGLSFKIDMHCISASTYDILCYSISIIGFISLDFIWFLVSLQTSQ